MNFHGKLHPNPNPYWQVDTFNNPSHNVEFHTKQIYQG